jgi:mono/diheme cytochrome c family protein
MFRNVLGDASSRSTWGKGKQRKYWFAPVVFAGAVVIIVALPLWALSDKPSAAKVTEDLPAGAMQAKATTACLECHEARIILQQRLGKGAWTKEVDKMVKWGAVVDASDRDALIDYLSTNFGPDQPAYEPPRTAADKNTSEESPRKPSK